MALRTVLSVVFATLFCGVTATERLVVAAGCFWSVELAYQRVPGVISTSVGYCGGIGDNPTYEQVSRGNTMHAEAVEIVYDEKVVSARTLIDLLWQIHDPTTLNRQGGDRGTQYRSHVWYTTDAQRAAFEASKSAYEATMSSFSGAIVTKLDSAADAPYWKAEDYHQQYLQKDGQDATKGRLKPIQCYGRRGPIKKMDKAEIRRILRKEEL